MKLYVCWGVINESARIVEWAAAHPKAALLRVRTVGGVIGNNC
jgi:hypothetical protein